MNEKENRTQRKSRAVHTDLNAARRDINEARKNERSIRRLKRILAVLIIIFVGLVIYVTYPFWLPKLEGIFDKPVSTIQNDGKTEDGNFPIEPDDATATQIYAVKNNLLTADAHSLTFYDENGKERSSYSHDFASPTVKVNGKRVLVFDSGSTDFKVYTKGGEVYSKTAENNILTADIGENGTAAIVTSSDKYSSAMQVYDNDGKLIYRYNCMQRIMAVTVDSDGAGCYVCTFSSENGEIYSQVRRIKFDSEQEVFEGDKLDGIAVACEKNSAGNIFVVSDESLYTLNSKGEILSSHEYGGTLKGFALDSGCAAVLLSESTGRSSSLIIASADSKSDDPYTEIGGLENAKQVRIYDKRVVLMTGDSAVSYTFGATLAATVQLSKDYSDFVYINSALYLLGRQGIDKIGFEM